MNASIDVYYACGRAAVACVLFGHWTDSTPVDAVTADLAVPAEYVPGQLYRRELPCLLAALTRVNHPIEHIVVDGFVHVKGGPGLGAHLHEALGGSSAVIGVAKNPLAIADQFEKVFRGRSRRPLLVSAIGIDRVNAAEWIRSMHGPYRVPTLIKMADTLSRVTAGLWMPRQGRRR
jgi:deoxyribonuclease V